MRAMGTIVLALSALAACGQPMGSGGLDWRKSYERKTFVDVIGYADTGYKFKSVDIEYLEPPNITNFFNQDAALPDFTNFYEVSFDDSAWSNGVAGFGNGYYGASSSPETNTFWSGYHVAPNQAYLLIRRAFSIPNGTTNVTMGFSVDNHSMSFLNGVKLTPANCASVAYVSEWRDGLYSTGSYAQKSGFYPDFNWWFTHIYRCEYDDLLLVGITNTVWHVGSNVLATVVFDDGYTSFFDNRIEIGR